MSFSWMRDTLLQPSVTLRICRRVRAETARVPPSVQPKKKESPPPALEPARVYTTHSPSLDSPPPLAHAMLPATVTNGSYYENASNGNSGYFYVHFNPTPSHSFSAHSL
ncbi:hypothetical protein BDZ89DRAFT_1137088 [Hymenopellis radicata]|nr:hypothetical protein BDZ89DRAFT_1137088 [Hymenopellis radicata]